MIVFTKELLQDSSILLNTIEKEKTMLDLSIKSQENLWKLLSDSMRKLTNSQETVTPLYTDFITSLVENQKNNLAFSKKNITLLENLLAKLEYIYNLYTQGMEITYELINEFNIAFLDSNNIVLENTLQIEKTLNLIFLFSEFTFGNENKSEKTNNINTQIISQNQPTPMVAQNTSSLPINQDCDTTKKQLFEKDMSITEVKLENKSDKILKDISIPTYQKNIETKATIPSRTLESLLKEHDSNNSSLKYECDKEIKELNITENTLIISEEKGKVFLPYTLSDLQEAYEKNPNKYSNLEDVVDKDYTVSLSFYKNASKARFKETFKLIHEKEKKSLKESLDLGMELFSNSNLHPAIISACRNKNELDNYLYHLAKNDTDNFECFKIIFDINPAVKSRLRF